MSDEIYKLMKQNLLNIKKIATPIEAIYDIDKDIEIDGPKRLYKDHGIKNEDEQDIYDHTAEEYIEYASRIGESIFVFMTDITKGLKENKGFPAELKKHYEENPDENIDLHEDTALPEPAFSTNMTILNKFPKIKQFIESKLKILNKPIEETIIIIINKGNMINEADTRSPIFFIHDILHSYEFKTKKDTDIPNILFELIADSYLNQENKSIREFCDNKEYTFKTSSIPFSFLNFPIGDIQDWQSHIFAYAIHKEKDFIITPNRFAARKEKGRGKPYNFKFIPSDKFSSTQELKDEAEKQILNYSKQIISEMKGSTIFNFI